MTLRHDLARGCPLRTHFPSPGYLLCVFCMYFGIALMVVVSAFFGVWVASWIAA